MGSAIFTAILDSVLKMAFTYLTGVMEKRGLIRQGQEQQAADETAKAEQSEARMNDALVNAPRTPTEAMDRLRKGTA